MVKIGIIGGTSLGVGLADYYYDRGNPLAIGMTGSAKEALRQ